MGKWKLPPRVQGPQAAIIVCFLADSVATVLPTRFAPFPPTPLPCFYQVINVDLKMDTQLGAQGNGKCLFGINGEENTKSRHFIS